MIALMMLGVLAGIILCFVFGFFMFRSWFGDKLGKGWAGALGLLVVFLIFFGDHIVKYVYFRGLCTFAAVNKVYDQEAYEIINERMKKDNYTRIKGKELNDLKEKYSIIDKKAFVAIIDENDNFLYFALEQNKENDNFLYRKVLRLSDEGIIYETKDFYGYLGGWICRTIGKVGGGCPLGTCEANRYGDFKKLRTIGAKW